MLNRNTIPHTRRLPSIAGLRLLAIVKTLKTLSCQSTRTLRRRTLMTTILAGHCASPGMHRLLTKLIDHGVLQTPAVAKVMSEVDRAAFVTPMWANSLRAYEDTPLPIGHGQTISAPHMHATALELLNPQLRQGARVLDVGSGSGYLTACFGLMVSPGGRVLGVEVVPELVEQSVQSLRRVVPVLIQDGTITIEAGNVHSAAGVLASEQP
ncbi:hypothetical protein VaNZ11_014447, partial [Volvox africanus]